MPVSIKDVARVAGVSHSTVSRALADSPLVRRETKERIKQVAREMGYTPNAAARSLVTRRSRTLGVVVTTIADPFVSEVVRGIEQVALDAGYGLFLCQSSSEVEREIASVRSLQEKRVDAIIVSASRVGDLYLPLLEEIRVPIVLVNNEQDSQAVHFVASDDVSGGRLAVEYLLSLGHRRIGYIAGPRTSRSSESRLKGYREALINAGISPDPRWVGQSDGRLDGGGPALRSLLSACPEISAVFCYNDATAIGALRFARESGLRVPEDLSIVGYDDIAFAAYTEPPLTTVAQHKYEMGQAVAKMALELIAGHEVQNLLLPTNLVVRKSCQAYARRR